MSKKTHYKTLINPDYLGAYSLDNGANGYNEADIIISKVEKREITGDGGKKSGALIALTNFGKPIILNATNRKGIAQITKSNYVEDWVNLPVTLFVQTGVRNPKGGTTDGLRIKQQVQRDVIDYTVQIAQITDCKTLDELKAVYSAFTLKEQTATLKAKDDMKGLLS